MRSRFRWKGEESKVMKEFVEEEVLEARRKSSGRDLAREQRLGTGSITRNHQGK